MVSRPELGSDPSFGSGRDLGCDRVYRQVVFHDVVRLVPSNRLYIIFTVVRSGSPTGGLP